MVPQSAFGSQQPAVSCGWRVAGRLFLQRGASCPGTPDPACLKLSPIFPALPETVPDFSCLFWYNDRKKGGARMKTMKKWVLPGILGLAVLCGGLRNAKAREPRIVSNLGAVLISCSVDSDQMMVAGIGPGYGPDMVVEVLGQPRSVKYGKATMEYTYPGRVIQLVKYSEDQNYQVKDITTTRCSMTATDRRTRYGRRHTIPPNSAGRTMPGTTPGLMKPSTNTTPTRPRPCPLRSDRESSRKSISIRPNEGRGGVGRPAADSSQPPAAVRGSRAADGGWRVTGSGWRPAAPVPIALDTVAFKIPLF